jgi:FtsH-binding integral membrane protein
MTGKDNEISIWFFIGISLLVNGVLITGAGIYEFIKPPENPVVLYQYHASLWWGAVLLIVGLVYCIKFLPGRTAKTKTTAAKCEEVHVR